MDFGRSDLAAVAPSAEGQGNRPPATGEQIRGSQMNLKQIALAVHSYHDAHNAFPQNSSKGSTPLLSWRVHILPYVEQDDLYRQFKLDEPWDSTHNRALIPKMPKLYAPIRAEAKEGETSYRGFDGPGTLFEKGRRLTFVNISDGTSNTAMVVEAGEPVVWTKPEDIAFDPKKTVPKLGGLFDGDFNMALCDGSVLRVGMNADPNTLKLVIQGNDGMPVDLDRLRK